MEYKHIIFNMITPNQEIIVRVRCVIYHYKDTRLWQKKQQENQFIVPSSSVDLNIHNTKQHVSF